ncbi:hypothetical protein GQ44DRAFT_767400 [Phaeosphaeriaceae sp. PMI808]|nr:hypothetical protein GQ44DRAFT_767400 [Phaeosphaeriaceae sp. PMI808]
MQVRFRKAPKSPKHHVVTPDENMLGSRFLQLPGEIRNIIYAQIVFPELSSLIISFGNIRRQRHFAKSVLRHPLFRTSHQVRVETLSYLCATKHLKILGVETAIAFFHCIGGAYRHLKRITLAQLSITGRPLVREQYSLLFYFLDQATELRAFTLEVGRIGFPYQWEKEVIGEDWAFLESVRDFVKKRAELKFQWYAGACEPSGRRYGHRVSRNQGISQLFNGKSEENKLDDVILLLY